MKRSLIIVTIVLGLLTAGFLARKQLIRGILPEVEKITAGNIAFVNDSATISLEVAVRNKGWISYDLKAVYIEVTNDTLMLVRYVNDSNYTLGKNETKIVPLTFEIPVGQAIRRIRSLQDQDSTQIAVKGWLEFSTIVGDVRIPVEQLFTVRVPIPPIVQVHEIEYLPEKDKRDKNEDGWSYNFRVKVSVINLNNTKFEFQGISYDFYGGELIESHGNLDNISVEALDSTYFNIPVEVQVEQRAKLLYTIITDKDVIGYSIKMRGTIVSFAGLHEEIPATFSNKGTVELYNPERKKIPVTIRKKKNGRKT